jgi:hypothetical protein
MSRTMKDIEAMGNASGRGQGAPKLEPGAQKALGRELRAMYDELIEEPVPDRFLQLLDQLEQSEKPAENKQDDPDSPT